jgi:hypothetical protein
MTTSPLRQHQQAEERNPLLLHLMILMMIFRFKKQLSI